MSKASVSGVVLDWNLESSGTKVCVAKEPQLYIDPVECIDCGACVPVCPVSAIFALDDLPKNWEHYAKINADHYGR
jgi:NAD-dependent dihydropyrimidine dehydrogenase PreA subunit